MTYAYRGGFEGLLTAVFEIYARHDREAELQNAEEGVCSLWNVTEVLPDRQRAGRVFRGLQKFSSRLPRTLYRAWLSRDPDADAAVLACIRMAFLQGQNPLDQKYALPVKQVCDLAHQVGCEQERMLQFVRFAIHPGGLAVADIEPCYDLLPLIANHFCQRFRSQPFAIRDLRHKKTLLWDTRAAEISEDPALLAPKLPEDKEFALLWKKYFKALAIPERKNLRLQQQFVPLRYRGHLTEMAEDGD